MVQLIWIADRQFKHYGDLEVCHAFWRELELLLVADPDYHAPASFVVVVRDPCTFPISSKIIAWADDVESAKAAASRWVSSFLA